MRRTLVAVVVAALCVLVSAVDDISIEYADTSNRMAFAETLATAPPATSTSAWKFDQSFGSAPSATGGRRLTQTVENRYAVKPIRTNSGYIKPLTGPGHSSTKRLSAAKVTQLAGKFVNPDGSVLYPGGTSWFNLLQLERFTEDAITDILRQHYQHGVRVLRTFGHNDGYGTTMPVQKPIQPRVGVFDEAALRRYDFVLDALSKAGIRITLTMTNHWPEYGGYAWYTNQVLGGGHAPELFYSSGRVIGAFQKWLKTLARRVNTVNGRLYAEDPTIFSWQLCNECHTSDGYEKNNGIVPGSLLYGWLKKNSEYMKNTLGVKQMVSIGSEGWRAKGKYDTTASVNGNYVNWMNSGLKGEDFVRNLKISTLDFATIHVYPCNWGIPASDYKWVNDNYIGDRSSLAAAVGKPLFFEEYGMPRGYMASRNTLFNSELAAANKYGAAGTLTWEVWTLSGDDVNYDYGYVQDGGASTKTMLARQVARTAAVAGSVTTPTPVPAPTPKVSTTCASKCGSAPKTLEKPNVPTEPTPPVKPVYRKAFYKRWSTRLKYKKAKQAYVKNLAVYGMNLAAYHNAKARYPSLLAAYKKAAAKVSTYKTCAAKCASTAARVATVTVPTKPKLKAAPKPVAETAPKPAPKPVAQPSPSPSPTPVDVSAPVPAPGPN